MGTSFVEYKGFCFWTRDSFLQDWLKSFLNEVKKLAITEQWQESLIVHWRTQASIDGGCMSIDLNEFLTDVTKRDFVLSVSRKALEHSSCLGRRTGELLIDLLEGKLTTTTSSPIVTHRIASGQWQNQLGKLVRSGLSTFPQFSTALTISLLPAILFIRLEFRASIRIRGPRSNSHYIFLLSS